MTLPANLFVDTPEAEDPSMTSLGNDASSWPEEIITKLKERIPSCATASLSIKFMHKDEEMGAATGSITVTNGEVAAVIPIIIKEFMLFPLDVIMSEGRILPLTSQHYGEIFQLPGQESFAGLSEFPMLDMTSRYMRGENLNNAIFPPNQGRYAFASAETDDAQFAAHYPILASVAKNFDGKAFFKGATSDERTVANFFNNGHMPMLKKLANAQPVNLGEFRQSADKLVQKDLHVLSKDGPNRYSILSGSLGHFSPAFSGLDRLGLHKFVSEITDHSEDVLNDLDQNGEKILAPVSDSGNTVFASKHTQEDVVVAENFGRYNVRTKSGVNVLGVVVPMVLDFDQNRIGAKLFLGKTNSVMQDQIAGVKVNDSSWFPCGTSPTVGQTGTFFYHEKDRSALATIPVTIRSVMKLDDCGNCSLQIRAVDIYGKNVNLQISEGCNQLERIASMGINSKGEREYMIPSKMEWIPMEGFDEVTNSAVDYNIKTAANTLTGDPVVFIGTGYNQYSARGLDKYASAAGWDRSNLTHPQASFLLANLSVPTEKIAQVLKQASTWGRVEIHNVIYPPLESEKIAQFVPKAKEIAARASSLRCDLTKEASYIENAQTVDAMLSLNFVSPDNIAKFISKIGIFKACISHLCSCVLASRIGVREIPEQAAASAISKLTEVVSGLEALRATQSIGKKQ